MALLTNRKNDQWKPTNYFLLFGLKLIQFPLCILAMSVILAYGGQFGYKVYCVSNEVTGTYGFGFPFRALNISLPRDLCAKQPTARGEIQLLQDHSAAAIAFLIISVLAVIHCLCVIIIWVVFLRRTFSDRIRLTIIIEFLIIVAFIVAWLIGGTFWMINSVAITQELDEKVLQFKFMTYKPCNTFCGPLESPTTPCCSFNSYSIFVNILYASPIMAYILAILYGVELFLLFRSFRQLNR